MLREQQAAGRTPHTFRYEAQAARNIFTHLQEPEAEQMANQVKHTKRNAM